MATEILNIIADDTETPTGPPEDSITGPSPEVTKTSLSESENNLPIKQTEIESTKSVVSNPKVVQVEQVNNGNVIAKVRKKYRNFLDSDSEEETNALEQGESGTCENISVNSASEGTKPKRLVDSDSDDEEILVGTNTNKGGDKSPGTNAQKPSRFRTIIDSDTDDEGPKDPQLKDEESRGAEPERKIKSRKINAIVDSESDDDSDRASPVVEDKEATSRKNRPTAEKPEKSKLSDLVDADSEDEERKPLEESFDEGNENIATGKKGGKAQKRTGSARASKDEAMRQIRSETQRLIRTSAVSLPYHRPKQRSLQDFLNRKKFIPALPEGLTTAAKLKMSSEIVGKVLEEKEKEAEIFYKSSDSEDEETSPVPVEDSRSMLIEETQRIAKNDVQNAHNKKEIIKQGGVDIGVPRKLFVDEPGHRMEEDDEEERAEGPSGDEDSARIDARRSKEAKPGMREASAPRKLFACDYDEGVDSPPKEADTSLIIDKAPKPDEEVDEGVHSLTKSNEVSSSSDNDANNFALRLATSALTTTASPAEIIESRQVEDNAEFDISETPFLSNREYARLKEQEKSSRASIDRATAEEPRVFGDVVGLPPPEFEDCPTSSSMKKKLLPGLSSVEPKLRGSPGMMIDLSDDSRDKEGVRNLVDRFLRHSATSKATPSDKNPVTVLHTEKTAEGVIKLVEEILPYKLPVTDGFTEKELQKPGAKYKRLRMDLIQKMAKKRDEEWKLREQRDRDENDEEEEEEDEEEIAEDDTADEASTESEPEVDDMPAEKRRKRKSRDFADEEAEVSGEEEDDEEAASDEEDEEDVASDEEDEDDQISLRVDDDASDPEAVSKPSRRIVSAFEDDSQPEAPQDTQGGRGRALERTKTDVDIFAAGDDWSSDAENEFPPSQILPREQADARSQLCKTPLTAINNVLRFVSPITQLTALNSSNETPRRESPASDQARSRAVSGSYTDPKTPRQGADESPIAREAESERGGCGFQKKLFQDPAGTVNDEELMGLCSGKFTSVENVDRANGKGLENNLGKVTETQLLRLCSGSFSSQNLLDLDAEDKHESGGDDDSQGVKLTYGDDSSGDKAATMNETSLRFDSSDDEVTGSPNPNVPKRKKVQKLDLSDEDDDGSDEDDQVSEEDREDDKYVDYDSEENEIVVVPKKDIRKVAANFLEAEAELSESEWGSEDEDEKDLDRLELEAGDDEDIDEDQMRDQLGKIHMRRVQDDDQREVRMLQELLFEDGDLHTEGSGRERKFKWKNIDQLANENENPEARADDAEENGNPLDDENDLEWRKQRIEREKFIEDKMKESTDEISEELAVDSQVFQLGIKALKRVKTNQTFQKEVEAVIVKPIASRTVLDLVDSQIMGQKKTTLFKAVTRGSFLARGDECLARMAEHIKQSSETTIVTRPNPKNFVFAHVSPSTMGAVDEAAEDDSKMEDSSENTKGKKRKSTAGVTPRSTKKAKVDPARTTGKKLF